MIFRVLILTLLPQLAFALPSSQPLLVMVTTPGGPIAPGVEPVTKTCEVWNNQVMLKKETGTSSQSSSSSVLINSQVIRNYIEQASKGTVTDRSGPTDMPTITITANLWVSTQVEGQQYETVMIHQFGSAGVKTNDSIAAAQLKAIAEVFCLVQ